MTQHDVSYMQDYILSYNLKKNYSLFYHHFMSSYHFLLIKKKCLHENFLKTILIVYVRLENFNTTFRC